LGSSPEKTLGWNGSLTRAQKPTANLVLQDTTERMFAQELYADVKHGVYIVRGENVLLLGEIVRLPPPSV